MEVNISDVWRTAEMRYQNRTIPSLLSSGSRLWGKKAWGYRLWDFKILWVPWLWLLVAKGNPEAAAVMTLDVALEDCSAELLPVSMVGGSCWVLATMILLGIHRDWCQVTTYFLNSSTHSFLVNTVAPLYRWVNGVLLCSLRQLFRKEPRLWKVQVSLIRDSIYNNALCFLFYGPVLLRLQCSTLAWTQIAVFHPQNFWFSRSRVGPVIWIFNKFPGDTEALGARTTMKELLCENKGKWVIFLRWCREGAWNKDCDLALRTPRICLGLIPSALPTRRP